jgi:hypothetical protein
MLRVKIKSLNQSFILENKQPFLLFFNNLFLRMHGQANLNKRASFKYGIFLLKYIAMFFSPSTIPRTISAAFRQTAHQIQVYIL